MDNDIQNWREIDENEILISYDNEAVMEDKDSEIDKWAYNEVFEEVEFKDKKMISVRWIITEKIKDKNKFYKSKIS